MESNDLKLNRDTCKEIIKMVSSTDVSNFTVAEEIIRNIDVEKNLPYLLMMYKEATPSVRTSLFLNTIKDKLNNCCKTMEISESSSITYNMIYEELKAHNVDEEPMEYFLERFAESIALNLEKWGFSFLRDYKIKLIPKS